MNIRVLVARAGLCVLLAAAGGVADAGEIHGEVNSMIVHGRYLAVISGCNDCHTAGYAENGGRTPVKDWLGGTALGWNGPWGTTYPPNLRLFMKGKTLKEWIHFARNANLRPPMPNWILRNMTIHDLTALYEFIRYLGPIGKPAPAYLPPGAKPKGPYVTWVLPAAGKSNN